MVLEISEEQRQLVLLALGRLSADRPGFDNALNGIAAKMDNVRDGRAIMYDEFRKVGREENPPTVWSRIRYEDPVYPPSGEPNMSQAHSKFKTFVFEGPLTQTALDGFSKELTDAKIAPKSVSVEYLESQKKAILSIGYNADEGYPVKLLQENLGKVEVAPNTIAAALETVASKYSNILCHEFYVTDDGNFFAILMLQG